MKIVKLETFRKLPENTLFSKYRPCVFEELAIKGETLEYDFLVTSDLSSAIKHGGSEDGDFGEILSRAVETGESIEMDFEIEGRDGTFEENQLFAVWEETDVIALIERLKRCLPNKPIPLSPSSIATPGNG